MSVGHLDIWLSEVGDPCGVFGGEGTLSVLGCDGVLRWPGGRYRTGTGGNWQPVPNGQYLNLPFKAGHIEVEAPPGCYAVLAAWVTPSRGFLHLNYSTHMAITQVRCAEVACVKVYNPSIRLCWDLFFHGLRALALQRQVDQGALDELDQRVRGEFLGDAPELAFEGQLREVLEAAAKQGDTGAEEGR